VPADAASPAAEAARRLPAGAGSRSTSTSAFGITDGSAQPTATPADQFDLAPLPEVVAAAHRLRRLTRLLGERRTEEAFQVALHITQRWAERRDFGHHRDQRLCMLGYDPDRFWLAAWHPAILAATYPDTVTLTGLLASPYWLAVAASPAHIDHQRFYAEVARRLDLPDYQPCTGWDPLARWIDRHAPQQDHERPFRLREEWRRCEATDIVGQIE